MWFATAPLEAWTLFSGGVGADDGVLEPELPPSSENLPLALEALLLGNGEPVPDGDPFPEPNYKFLSANESSWPEPHLEDLDVRTKQYFSRSSL